MFDLPPPPTEIVYEMPDKEAVQNFCNKVQAKLDYVVDHPEVLQKLSKEKLREFREALAYLARQAAKDATPEEKAKLEEDIRNLLSDDEEVEVVEENTAPIPLSKASYGSFKGYSSSIHTAKLQISGYHSLIHSSYTNDYEIIQCGLWDKTCHFFKKVGKGVIKVVDGIIDFIEDHPILAAGAIVTTDAGIMVYEKLQQDHPIPLRGASDIPASLPSLNQWVIPENPRVAEQKNPVETSQPPISDPVGETNKGVSEPSAPIMDKLGSRIAHEIWEVFGRLTQETEKTLQCLQKVDECVNESLDLPQTSLNLVKPDDLLKDIHQGHEQIDQWFGTNFKNDYPRQPLDQETQLKLDAALMFLSPAPGLNKAEAILSEAEEITTVVINKLKGLLTTEKDLPILEKAGATVQREIDETIQLSKKLYPEAESSFYEKNLNESTKEWPSRNSSTTISQENVIPGSSEMLIEGFSIQKLAESGKVFDRAGLTKAGRALAKHGGREGSIFPNPIGTPTQINQQGQAILESILKNPDTKIYDLGENGFKIFAPDGKGLHYSKEGTLKGFVESQYEKGI